MFFVRAAIHFVTDTFRAISDGANEIIDYINPKKRPRSASSAPQTHPHPHPHGPIVPHHTSASAPTSPYNHPLPQSPYHPATDRTSTSPTSSVYPPSGGSPLDDLQPRAKRRRVSITSADQQQQQHNNNNNNNYHHPQHQTFSPNHPNQNSPSQAPFGVLRRSSSGLGDALEAPTPPQLAFASSRARVNTQSNMMSMRNNKPLQNIYRPMPFYRSTFYQNHNNNNNSNNNNNYGRFNQRLQHRPLHQNRFASSPFHRPTGRPSAYQASARNLRFEPRPFSHPSMHNNNNNSTAGASSTVNNNNNSNNNNNNKPTTTSSPGLGTTTTSSAVAKSPSKIKKQPRRNGNNNLIHYPPTYPRASVGLYGENPSGAPVVTRPSPLGVAVNNHSAQKPKLRRSASTNEHAPNGGMLSSTFPPYRRHGYLEELMERTGNKNKDGDRNGMSIMAHRTSSSSLSPRKRSCNDKAVKDAQSQHAIPATFLDLAARGAALKEAQGVKNDIRSLVVLDSVGSKAKLEAAARVRAEEEERKVREDNLNKRMILSKKRSSDLYLQMFVTSQQRLQDVKRREDAQRLLERSDSWRDEVFGKHDEEEDEDDGSKVEMPPTDVEKGYWNVNYYDDRDGRARAWVEESDEDAVAEREHGITVVQTSAKLKALNRTSAYAPLTEKAVLRLKKTMNDRMNVHEVLAKFNGCEITGGYLRMLQPGKWLNDEVINAYMVLLGNRNESARAHAHMMKTNGTSRSNGNGHSNGEAKGRSSSTTSSDDDKDSDKNGHNNKWSSPSPPPKVKMMNSFFYSKLMQFGRYDYSNVRRWTRKEDVFSNDVMLIPINQQNIHWTLGVIDFGRKRVLHLDSMATGGDPLVRRQLLQWVRDEASQRGKDGEWSAHDWQEEIVEVPAQGNTDDCGVFLCKFADFLARGWNVFTFEHGHMRYFRARMAHELLVGRVW